jgi:hypothetical protein
LGDKGFIGVPRFIHPFRRLAGVAVLGDTERRCNGRINQLRWRVETAFLHTKKWRIFKLGHLQGRWFSHDTIFGLWSLACILHNEWMDWQGQ